MRRTAILLIASILLAGCGAVASPPQKESIRSLPETSGEVAEVTTELYKGETLYRVVMKEHPDIVYKGVPYHNCVDGAGETSEDNRQISFVKPGNRVSFHWKQFPDARCIADISILA